MLSRNLTTKIAYLFDELIPPVLRDQRWFMRIPFAILFGGKADVFFDFKDRAFDLTMEEFKDVYEQLESVHIQRETDLNDHCIQEVLANTGGGSILEVGCGRGYLAGQLANNGRTTACDMVVSSALATKYPNVEFKQANIESLPFETGSFDTVISTHTLEHVLDIRVAVQELRRVAKKRLIIVVPKQRPYKYTFDLHIHFFPYKHSLLACMAGTGARKKLKLLGGDWYYQEDT